MAKSEDTSLVRRITDAFPALTGNLGADIKEAMAANLGEGETLRMWDLERVKIPAGGTLAWEVPDKNGAPEYLKELDGIVVFTKRGRSYWIQSIDEGGSGNPPDCSSPDGLVGYGNPGGPCKVCPLSQFGERDEAPSCKALRFMFLLREGAAFPTLVPLPPTSIGAVDKWLRQITMKGKTYWSFLVRLSLVQAENSANIKYSRAVLSVLRPLAAEEIAAVTPFAQMTRQTFADYREGEPGPVGEGQPMEATA